MAKYKLTSFIEAEQYLPSKDQIPQGVILDGRRNKADRAASTHYIKTSDGASYLTEGDYLVTYPDGTTGLVRKEVFEKTYKPV